MCVDGCEERDGLVVVCRGFTAREWWCLTGGKGLPTDLRSCRRVCRFQGHTARVQPIGVEFSPCLRYVATGSEDRCAYLYDVRMGSGTYLAKLSGHPGKACA